MNRNTWYLVALMGWAGLAQAEFVAPTAEQLAAVAAQPKQVGALLQQASVAQVAEVIRDAVARIVALGLSPAERDARIRTLLGQAFAARAGDAVVLAAALGTTLADTPSSVIPPAVVSVVQQSTIAAAGDQGSAAGTAFGEAYVAAQAGNPAASGTTGRASTIPPPPPVGKQYEGLTLK